MPQVNPLILGFTASRILLVFCDNFDQSTCQKILFKLKKTIRIQTRYHYNSCVFELVCYQRVFVNDLVYQVVSQIKSVHQSQPIIGSNHPIHNLSLSLPYFYYLLIRRRHLITIKIEICYNLLKTGMGTCQAKFKITHLAILDRIDIQGPLAVNYVWKFLLDFVYNKICL